MPWRLKNNTFLKKKFPQHKQKLQVSLQKY